jgi:Zn-dependent protease
MNIFITSIYISIAAVLFFIISTTIHNYIIVEIATQKLNTTLSEKCHFGKKNPIKHLDLLGTALFLSLVSFYVDIGLGWAKSILPSDFEKATKKEISISLLFGPLSYLILALIFFLLSKGVLYRLPANHLLVGILTTGAQVNLGLLIIDLIPIAPSTSYSIVKQYIPRKLIKFFESLELYSPWLKALILSPISPLSVEMIKLIKELLS